MLSSDDEWLITPLLLRRTPQSAPGIEVPRASREARKIGRNRHTKESKQKEAGDQQGCVAFQANREGRVDNLRSSPRLDVQLPVRVNASGMSRETTTINVSAGAYMRA